MVVQLKNGNISTEVCLSSTTSAHEKCACGEKVQTDGLGFGLSSRRIRGIILPVHTPVGSSQVITRSSFV